MLITMASRLDHLIPSWREFAISLGIIAVLMRALIAPGFMPDLTAAAAGDFKLVICSAGSLKTIPMDADSDAPDSGHGDTEDLCAFAALSHVALHSDTGQTVNSRVELAVEIAPNRGAITASAVRTPAARAPPLFS